MICVSYVELVLVHLLLFLYQLISFWQNFKMYTIKLTQSPTGIWVWGTPVELVIDGVKVSVLYLDTEGFESVGKSNVYDDRWDHTNSFFFYRYCLHFPHCICANYLFFHCHLGFSRWQLSWVLCLYTTCLKRFVLYVVANCFVFTGHLINYFQSFEYYVGVRMINFNIFASLIVLFTFRFVRLIYLGSSFLLDSWGWYIPAVFCCWNCRRILWQVSMSILDIVYLKFPIFCFDIVF